MKGRTEHVVCKDGGGFRCLHCGQDQDMAMPCALPVWVAASEAFVEMHAGCAKPEGARCNFCNSADGTVQVWPAVFKVA